MSGNSEARPPTLSTIYPKSRETDEPFIRDGMSPIELRKLGEIIREVQPWRVLEIGMANGTSSVVMVEAMRANGRGELTSVDPNQTRPTPKGYNSAGIQAVAQITTTHTLIENLDYLALPELVAKACRYDVILIDGFHSFDLTLLDVFYADLLLKVGGLLLCHDSSSPPVYKALRWLETNKPYRRLSPALYTARFSRWTKLINRVWRSAERRDRVTSWGMLVAYQKREEHAMAEHQLTEF